MKQRTKYLILIYILFFLCGIITSFVGFSIKSCNDDMMQSALITDEVVTIYDTPAVEEDNIINK